MKKLILSVFVVFVALSFNQAKAQNATGNASDAGVPLTAPPPQTTSPATTTTTTTGVNAVNSPALTVPTAPPVVTVTPVTATPAAVAAAPAVPAAPAAPAPPAPGTPPPASTFTTTLNLPVVAVPVTVPLPQLPDVRVPIIR